MMGYEYSDGERLEAAVEELEIRGVTVSENEGRGYKIFKSKNPDKDICQELRCLLISGLASTIYTKNRTVESIHLRAPNRVS